MIAGLGEWGCGGQLKLTTSHRMLGMLAIVFLLQSGDGQQYFLWLTGISAVLAIFCRNPYNCA
ncbi:hypothetical protein [Yersinia sp. Marseille-Q3913]|uniref:hypothetical protein n=1 Tax=Yersinia sp. Marseille-Q3913 TaxID=2830769 RepID=UPI001BAF5DB0|nr:hypothetical protein [Yersinia sp. Marseille-Q3913]MBS0057563.1 hypothetical protein [Yersinia sp. Marseille-Q3913]